MGVRANRGRTTRRLGQHFLADPVAVGRIVEAAGVGVDDLVVEIGPGRGALTGLLLERARRVVGIELDRSLCAFLEQTGGGRGDLSILQGDVLQVNLGELVQREGFERAVLVGNLPYRITGACIEQILDARAVWTRAVLMVQREVARRMTASPGGKEYGILSIAVQLWSRPERLFDLAPGCFRPAPKVHSSALRLDFPPDPSIRVEDERFFFRVVRTAFQQRRKMLKNSLGGLVRGREDSVIQVLSGAGVDPHLRPEAVSMAQFEQVCRGLAALTQGRTPADAQKGKGIGTA